MLSWILHCKYREKGQLHFLDFPCECEYCLVPVEKIYSRRYYRIYWGEFTVLAIGCLLGETSAGIPIGVWENSLKIKIPGFVSDIIKIIFHFNWEKVKRNFPEFSSLTEDYKPSKHEKAVSFYEVERNLLRGKFTGRKLLTRNTVTIHSLLKLSTAPNPVMIQFSS